MDSWRKMLKESKYGLIKVWSTRKKARYEERLSRFAKLMKASAASMLSRSTAARKDMPWT